MEEKILKNIQSKRMMLKIVCILGVAFAIVWIVFVENDIFIRKIDITKIEINTGNEYIYSLDDVSWKKDDISITKDYVTLSGWMIKKGEEIKTVSIKVVFQDVNTERCYVIPTAMFERGDVTENINDGLDYKNSGFSVKIPYNKRLEKTDYKLYLLYTLNEKQVLVPLNTTLKEWKAR